MLMDRPLEEAVKIKVSRVSAWASLFLLSLSVFCDNVELDAVGEKQSESDSWKASEF